MTKVSNLFEASIPQPEIQTQARSSLQYDWVIALFGLWMIGGLHLDAWAHHHIKLETFFTPWHAVLYSGYLALAIALAGAMVKNRLSGSPWKKAIPTGYELSIAGAVLFGIGGFADMIWHTLFGIEVNIEALLSPTHLLLALGGALMITGPIRAAWSKAADSSKNGANLYPAVFSSGILLAELSFFTAYANPLSETMKLISHRPPTELQGYYYQALGISAILLQSIIMLGVLLLVVRRWQLPPGSIALIVIVANGLTISIHEIWYMIPFVFLAGITAEALYRVLKPSSERVTPFRWFALGVPFLYYSLYFLALRISDGMWWSVHLWTGVIVLAGVAGWLLSYGFIAPQTSSV